MPIGPPSHVPDPKSAWTWAPEPIAATYVADFGWTGSFETSACQTSCAGKIVHVAGAATSVGGGAHADTTIVTVPARTAAANLLLRTDPVIDGRERRL